MGGHCVRNEICQISLALSDAKSYFTFLDGNESLENITWGEIVNKEAGEEIWLFLAHG